ncbi:MAG: rhomboid family intramembrane serine protease [Nanoarchaeota archaeon]
MQNKGANFWLMGICVVMFVLQLVIPGFTEALLMNKFALPEVWRFVTAIFLHGGFSHLLLNMFAMLMFGMMLEHTIGTKKYLLVFFLTGILANIISYPFYDSALGASGAIFGLIGAMVMLKPGVTIWAFGMPMPLFIAGILWAFVDIIGVFVPSGVGNIAHLSGMGLGLILGAKYRNWAMREERKPRVELDERYVQSWENANL